jgi:hypothetical protein
MPKKTADIDFAKQDQKTDPDWTPTGDTPNESLPTPSGFWDDMEGEQDNRGIQLPRLSLIHPLDKRAEEFKAGRFVYNNEVELESPFQMVAIKSKKGYFEKIDRKLNPTGISRIVWSAAEVRSMGGSLDYPCPPDAIPFGDMAELLILISQSKDDKGLFPFEFEGKSWAPASYRVKGTAYTRVFKILEAARALSLRQGLIYGRWSVSTVKETVNNNQTYVPVVKFSGKNSPEYVDWLKDLLKGF